MGAAPGRGMRNIMSAAKTTLATLTLSGRTSPGMASPTSSTIDKPVTAKNAPPGRVTQKQDHELATDQEDEHHEHETILEVAWPRNGGRGAPKGAPRLR